MRKRRYMKVDVSLKVFHVDADKMYAKQVPQLPIPVRPEKKP